MINAARDSENTTTLMFDVLKEIKYDQNSWW